MVHYVLLFGSNAVKFMTKHNLSWTNEFQEDKLFQKTETSETAGKSKLFFL